jgi:HSP20 family protein
MSDLFLTSPFDILFKDFFNSSSPFTPAHQAKYTHPVDIYDDEKGLHIEVACTGISKDEIDITIENGSVLKISYKKPEDLDPEKAYIHKSISRRSFNLGYRISSKFDLSKAEADYEHGLLYIDIPFTKTAKPKTIKINERAPF